MVIDLKPKMTSAEVELLEELVNSDCIYLEFGCGGSTAIAARQKVKKLYSIETDAEWISKCQSHSEIANMISLGRAKIIHIDIGRLRRWGKPATKDRQFIWVAYSAGVWQELTELPNLILVDGRWRVACALQALWRCGDNARILVHDWNQRERYHELLEFADIDKHVGSLVSLVPKPDRDRGLIAMRALDRVSDYS